MPAAPDTPPEITEAFTAAVVTTFGELTQTAVEPGTPYLNRAGPPSGWVTATIALVREGGGRMTVALPRPVLEALTTRYLAGGTPITPELADDAAGEFANVIAGQAKAMLRGTPHHFTLTTPRVGIGGDPSSAEEASLTLPFTTDLGEMTVSVTAELLRR